MAIDALAMLQSYEIVSVRRAKPMPDLGGSDWYSYVISYEGKDNIHGYRQGDLESVTMAIEEIVTVLNERHLGHFRKPGRVHVEKRGRTALLPNSDQTPITAQGR